MCPQTHLLPYHDSAARLVCEELWSDRLVNKNMLGLSTVGTRNYFHVNYDGRIKKILYGTTVDFVIEKLIYFGKFSDLKFINRGFINSLPEVNITSWNPLFLVLTNERSKYVTIQLMFNRWKKKSDSVLEQGYKVLHAVVVQTSYV